MMVSKKNKQPELSGLVVVDKPLGVTSHDVVAAMRGELHMRRVGHAGTLDPQASGVLVIGFGHGTRLLNYIVDHTKTYEATIRLGQTSTTDDSEGEITTVAPVMLADGAQGDAAKSAPVKSVDGTDGLTAEVTPVKLADDSSQSSDSSPDSDGDSGNVRVLTLQEVEQAIKEHLTGDIEQVPSSYSAVRVNGRHAYELARQGKTVELDARPVTISEFTVLGACNAEVRYTAENGKNITEKSGNSETSDGAVSTADSSYAAADCETMDEPTKAADGAKKPKAAEPSALSASVDSGVFNAGFNNPAAVTTSVVDVDVRISCSTGTYIRSLGRDLGQLLGVGGYLTRLRRTRVGKFDLADPQLAGRVVTAHAKPHTFTNREGVTLTLNKAVLDVDADELKRRSLTMLEAAQRTMPTIPVSDEDAQNLRFGRRLPMPSSASVNAKSHINADETSETDGIAAVYLPQTDEVVGIVKPANSCEMKSVVVFPPQ